MTDYRPDRIEPTNDARCAERRPAGASAPSAHDFGGTGSDGSIYIRNLTIPPSELWSAAFHQYHVKLLTDAFADCDFPVPSRAASKEEWDRFDAWKRERGHAGPLALALQHYPVEIEEADIAGVHVAIVTPREGVSPENKNRVLINLHGGGFVYNQGLAVGQLESIPMAALGKIKVVTLDYRQAPDYSYPAATVDVAAVYERLLDRYVPEAIGLFGCSAGGALTSQALAWFQSVGLPRPAAAGIFSIGVTPPCIPAPWGRGWGDSVIWFSTVAPSNQLTQAHRVRWEPTTWYMESADANDSRAYPGLSDTLLAKFPPTLFLSGTRDFALSASVTSHARLVKLGVDSSLYIIEGASHCAHVFAVDTPEAHDAQAYAARWLTTHLTA